MLTRVGFLQRCGFEQGEQGKQGEQGEQGE